MKILVIDNFDSFTYNIVYIVKKAGHKVDVIRNNQLDISACKAYDRVLLSPGPGIPSEAGNLMEFIAAYAGKVPILGVCLGHQAIGEYLGGTLINLPTVFHGIQSEIKIENNDSTLFSGLPRMVEVGRYHSWCLHIQDELSCSITARTEEGEIMALESDEKMLYGVQFHPESILTPNGDQIILNFIDAEYN